MAKVELTGISKAFGEISVLKNIDLQIEDGEFVTLVGPSGCGKSTLLRILAGLEAADKGRVLIDGRDVTQIRPANRNLAMVFQSYALYPHLSVAENMMTPLRLRDLSRAQRLPLFGPLLARSKMVDLKAQVLDAAQTLKIDHLLARKPGELSGGQRQRAALGRALVRNPVAFLMDEPLSNLDAALRVHMRAELAELHRRLATTFVYVTHDQAEALTMSDRMAVMMGGKILQIGPPDVIYNDPHHLEVAKFVGSPPINLLPGEISGAGTVTLFDAPIGHARGHNGAVMIGLRPEAVSLAAQGPKGRVVHRENLGSEIYLHVVLEQGALEQGAHRVVLRTAPHTSVGLGDSVRLAIDAARALIFNPDGRRLGFTERELERIA
ncbi:MAG: ABC transporter ATP-binding protein [Pseudomonadota bacterium]